MMQIDIISSLFGFIIGFLSFIFIIEWRQCYEKNSKSKSLILNNNNNKFEFHWNPLIKRRGLGDLLTKVNHIAITVSDVGKSLSFYVDILGLQQIRRPTFDRHGAWLTMGNIELHLIKGIPAIPPVDNLQVTHIALETTNVDQVIQKLQQLNIDIRQSYNVTNAYEPKSKENSRIIQYFFNDPDGYYIELCNCDVLTDFIFSSNQTIDNLDYNEGIHNDTVFQIVQSVSHWKTKGRKHSLQELNQILEKIPRADSIDQDKFNNLIRRRSIYGDIIQGFDDQHIKEALLQSNNIVPIAVQILDQKRGQNKYFQPVPYIQNGQIVEPKPFIINQNNSTELTTNIST